MGGLWYGGMGAMVTSTAGSAQSSRAESMALQSKEQAKAVEHQVQRLSLLNQALWEILRDRLKMTVARKDDGKLVSSIAVGARATDHAIDCSANGPKEPVAYQVA